MGNIVETVTATGTVTAAHTVDVGTQVTGQITHLHADFNSIVHAGEVIAELDTAPFVTQVQAAEATAEKARIDRDGHQAALDVDDAIACAFETLLGEGLASPQDAEQARAQADLDRTQLKDDDAEIVSADSTVEQAKLNLAHCTITSPIDGVVVERDVDEGQTVTSSTSAPRLFLIATDLRDLRVMGNIDEAEVSKLRPGQMAVFTVPSYPGPDVCRNRRRSSPQRDGLERRRDLSSRLPGSQSGPAPASGDDRQSQGEDRRGRWRAACAERGAQSASDARGLRRPASAVPRGRSDGGSDGRARRSGRQRVESAADMA